MTRQTTPTAQWDWGEQLIRPLEKIAERVGEYDPDDETSDFEEMLLEPLSISGGESFTAEDHRGREILELLQNAQDASGGLYEPDSDPTIGTRGVYIGITDDGLLVANTGDSFDFSDPDRRKSLRILGHSETSEETIGQFGVGLTSIRSMGEAYEVWTKAPDQAGTLEAEDCWRVFCGPRTTLAAIASATPTARGNGPGNDAYERFENTAIGGADVLDVPTNNNPMASIPLLADQIPYFTYPVAMESWNQSGDTPSSSDTADPLRDRATDLLTDDDSNLKSCPSEIQSLLSDVGAFTTAVFVDFEDDDWRQLFEAITGTQPAAPDENPAERLEEQAWFANTETNRVTPELLLNLGHIDRLVVERFGDGPDEPSSFQSWDVFGQQRVDAADADTLPIAGREIQHGSGADAVAVNEVAVQLETACSHDHLDTPAETDATTYTFWDSEFTAPHTYGEYDWYDHATTNTEADAETGSKSQREQEIEVSVLLQTATSDGGSELYAPHLYYPISGAEKQFPYCIHGDFVVRQNRQSLAGSGLKRNCVVAVEAARLIGQVSEALATAPALPQTERAAIPWRLLPAPVTDDDEATEWPTPESVVTEQTGQVADNEPLRLLRAEIYRRLRQHTNIQVVSTDEPQTSLVATAAETLNVVIHDEPSVLAGISALYPLVTHADADLDPTPVLQHTDSAIDLSIPTETTIDALLRWLVDDSTRDSGEPTATADRERLSEALLKQVQTGTATNRGERLSQFVSGDGDSDLESQLLTPWWTVLQAWSERISTQTDVGCAITGVPPQTGQAVLEATVKLGADDDAFPDGTAFTPDSEGPYLLPCDPFIQEQEPAAVHGAGDIQLVRVESHETRGDHQRQVLRPQNDSYKEIVPGAETGFALYLLSGITSPRSQQVIKSANWGTREYAGAADLYRTLLRDLHEAAAGISIADFTFLITVYNAIDFDASTTALDAVEGGYHPREQVKKLANSTTAVENLKPRANARQVSLPATLLDRAEPQPGYTVRFGTPFIREWLANHFDTAETESTPIEALVEADDAHLSQPPIQTDGPVATLPPAENAADLAGYSAADIATQLGMLGVSVLPGVQTLLLRGDDDHPDRQTVSSWNPTTWTTPSGDRLSALLEVLATPRGQRYLESIVTPPYGPGESSDHTPNCTVKEYPQNTTKTLAEELAGYDVMLTSWVWLDPARAAAITAPELANLLTLYGDALADSILYTGWSCDFGKGNTQGIANAIPTLLNWQLRAVPGWGDIEWFHTPTIEGLWTDHDEWGLKYAVLEANIDNRSTAASVFPRIDPSASPIAESVWQSLGVTELEELNATEAARRLNALLDAASAPAVDQDGDTPTAVELPGIDAIDAWQTLYGKLLNIIGTEIHERGDGMTLEKLQFLDRVPAQTSDGTWVGLTHDALERAVYYDSTESDWEDRLAQLEDATTDVDADDDRAQYLLPRPASRHIRKAEFAALWKGTAATQQPSQYPEIDHANTTDAAGDELQQTLRDPEIKYGVLAAAPGTEAQADHRNQYETITETLRRIDHRTTDSVDRETAWRVTPVGSEPGLQLDNVTTASNYAVAYDGRVVDPTEPTALADLFIALYGGGNKDSYKLALLGRDVEGKETVREELRESDVQELETDLRLAAALFDDITIEPGTVTPKEISVQTLREEIAHSVEAGDPETLSPETATALDESVLEAITAMCRSEVAAVRSWAGRLIKTAESRTETLQAILSTDRPDASPSPQQVTALQRLEATLPRYRGGERLPGFNELLPNGQPRRMAETFQELISGLQRTTHPPTRDGGELAALKAAGESVAWADQIAVSGEQAAPEGVDSRAARGTVIEDETTWFHVAWSLAATDQPPLETAPAAALLNVIAEFLGGDPATYREEIRQLTDHYRPSTTGQSRRSVSSDEYTETETSTLFGQMATGTEWNTPTSSGPAEYTATGSSLDSDSTSGGGGGAGDGPITQTGDQPRVAELTVLQQAYAALYEASLSPDTIHAQLAAMQLDPHNAWRDGHDRFTVDAVPAPDQLGESAFPIDAFDLTDAGIVGYDILDLTGWAIRQVSTDSAPSDGVDLDPYRDPDTLTPVPVEVKSVDPDRPSFKFSLNQYQSAYRFVTPVGERGAVPYVVYLVDVSRHETDGEPEYSVEPYDTIIITSPSDLRQLLPPELSPDENETLIDTFIETIYGGDLMISK